MSGNRRVAWSQGMFLQPQHFQQFSRAMEEFAIAQAAVQTRLNWGFSGLEIDAAVLKQGQFRLLSAKGILPDGTPFDAPDTDALPAAITIASEHLGKKVWLALPLRTPGEPEYELSEEVSLARRGRAELTPLRDCSDREQESIDAHVVGLNLQLIVSDQPPPGYTSLPIRRVAMIGQGNDVRLAADFVESAVIAVASDYLRALIADLANRLAQRSRNSSGRAARGGSTETLYEFLFLLAVNRRAPVLRQLMHDGDVHPYALYLLFVEMAGEFASFGQITRAAPEFSAYDHADQYRSFVPVAELLRTALGQVLPQTATHIPLVRGELGIFYGVFPDSRLVSPKHRLVLTVLCDSPPEVVRQRFSGVALISTPDTIKNQIGAQVPGFAMSALPVAPQEVRNPSPRAVYFEIRPETADYKRLVNGLAVNVSTNIPGLQLELWVLHGAMSGEGDDK